MRAQEAVVFSNISATTAAFTYGGGVSRFTVTATFGGGNVGLEQLGPDGVTWLATLTALTVNGSTAVSLPPGQFRVSVATATAVYTQLARVPGE
jgi:hypothetical protein